MVREIASPDETGRHFKYVGVSGAEDPSIVLVGQIWDIERARQTQRLMEYDPAPPYAGALA